MNVVVRKIQYYYSSQLPKANQLTFCICVNRTPARRFDITGQFGMNQTNNVRGTRFDYSLWDCGCDNS